MRLYNAKSCAPVTSRSIFNPMHDKKPLSNRIGQNIATKSQTMVQKYEYRLSDKLQIGYQRESSSSPSQSKINGQARTLVDSFDDSTPQTSGAKKYEPVRVSKRKTTDIPFLSNNISIKLSSTNETNSTDEMTDTLEQSPLPPKGTDIFEAFSSSQTFSADNEWGDWNNKTSTSEQSNICLPSSWSEEDIGSDGFPRLRLSLSPSTSGDDSDSWPWRQRYFSTEEKVNAGKITAHDATYFTEAFPSSVSTSLSPKYRCIEMDVGPEDSIKADDDNCISKTLPSFFSSIYSPSDGNMQVASIPDEVECNGIDGSECQPVYCFRDTAPNIKSKIVDEYLAVRSKLRKVQNSTSTDNAAAFSHMQNEKRCDNLEKEARPMCLIQDFENSKYGKLIQDYDGSLIPRAHSSQRNSTCFLPLPCAPKKESSLGYPIQEFKKFNNCKTTRDDDITCTGTSFSHASTEPTHEKKQGSDALPNAHVDRINTAETTLSKHVSSISTNLDNLSENVHEGSLKSVRIKRAVSDDLVPRACNNHISTEHQAVRILRNQSDSEQTKSPIECLEVETKCNHKMTSLPCDTGWESRHSIDLEAHTSGEHRSVPLQCKSQPSSHALTLLASLTSARVQEVPASVTGYSSMLKQAIATSAPANIAEPHQAKPRSTTDRHESTGVLTGARLNKVALKSGSMRQSSRDLCVTSIAIPGTLTQVNDEGPTLAFEDDPTYAKYFKMLKMGLSLGAVKNAIKRDGFDPIVMDGAVRNAPATIKNKVLNVTSKEDDPTYAKYFRMLKVGLSLDAVKNAIKRDGLNPSVMEGNCKAPILSITKDSHCPKSTGVQSSTPKDKYRRARIHWSTHSPIREDTVWSMIDEDADVSCIKIDESEFARLFQQELNYGVGVPVTSQSDDAKPEYVIDRKRANDGGIVLARVKLTYDQMAKAVDAFDNRAFTQEQIKGIMHYTPTKEEKNALKNYLSKKDSTIDLLCECEKFMVAMMDVPELKEKLHAISFMQNFATSIEELQYDTQLVQGACEEILSSVRLRKILGIVLKVGNRLNTAGENSKRKAEAITLDSLLKLNRAKALDRKTTFLHYVASVVKSNNAFLTKFKDELPTIFTAQKIQWDASLTELKRLEHELNDVHRLALRHGSENADFPDRHDAPEVLLSTPVGRFASEAAVELSFLVDCVQKATQQFIALQWYFGEEHREIMQPHEVFQIIATFSDNFDNALEEVIVNEKAKSKKSGCRAMLSLKVGLDSTENVVSSLSTKKNLRSNMGSVLTELRDKSRTRGRLRRRND